MPRNAFRVTRRLSFLAGMLLGGVVVRLLCYTITPRKRALVPCQCNVSNRPCPSPCADLPTAPALAAVSQSPHVQEIWQNTEYDPSFRLSLPTAEPDRTTLRVSSLYGMNFATARNVCVKPDRSKTIFVYSETPEPSFLSKRSGFTWGWRFHTHREKVPRDATRVAGTTLIVSPAFTHHVTHFAESTIPLWHAFRNSHVYPVHSAPDRIFLKQSDFRTELAWNQKILQFLAHHARNVSITDSSFFQGSALVCFDKAGLVGMGLHEFGFFASKAEAVSFKQSIFAFFHLQLQSHSSIERKARCLVLQRTRSRRLENRQEVIQTIEDTGLYDCVTWSPFTHGEMENMPFESQLALVASTQFMVALHGSGLVNSIFLPQHSAVVDLLPHDYLELEWHNFASKAGVRFFFMFLGDTRCRNQCTGHIFETSKPKCRSVMQCNHKLVDSKTLQVIAAQADFHIRTLPNIRKMNANITWSAGAARNDKPLLPPQALPRR